MVEYGKPSDKWLRRKAQLRAMRERQNSKKTSLLDRALEFFGIKADQQQVSASLSRQYATDSSKIGRLISDLESDPDWNHPDGLVWTAVLDSAVCPICVGLDGKRYPPDYKKVSVHPGCRCVLLPWKWSQDMTDPSGKKVQPTRLSRGDKGGDEYIPARTEIADWLKTNPSTTRKIFGTEIGNQLLGVSLEGNHVDQISLDAAIKQWTDLWGVRSNDALSMEYLKAEQEKLTKGRMHYSQRDSDDNLKEAVEIFEKMLSNAKEAHLHYSTLLLNRPPDWPEAYLDDEQECKRNYASEIHDLSYIADGYRQLAIIYEKQNRFNDAIRACLVARDGGWSGDWDARMIRYRKKATRTAQQSVTTDSPEPDLAERPANDNIAAEANVRKNLRNNLK